MTMPEDAEACFDRYIAHTEPLSGAIQDDKIAVEYLKKAHDLEHPDATFVLGNLIYKGAKGFDEDRSEGVRLMKLGKAQGANPMVDAILARFGIDLDADHAANQETNELSGSILADECRERIDELDQNGELTKEQYEDLYEIVRTVDEMHLVNVFAMLNTPDLTAKLTEKAGRITGWDGENAIFYVSPHSLGSTTNKPEPEICASRPDLKSDKVIPKWVLVAAIILSKLLLLIGSI